jgi:hypothetical protein
MRAHNMLFSACEIVSAAVREDTAQQITPICTLSWLTIAGS